MTNIAQKLRDLADEIEREPKSEPAQQYPPKGVAIEIRIAGIWCPRVSAGGGLIYTPDGGRSLLRHFFWRYAPAPWDIAPEPAVCWVVTDIGESFWTLAHWYEREKVNGGTIVHVEHRPGTEEAQR